VTWNTPVAGQGWSSPSLYGGTLFFTAAVPQGEGDKVDYDLQLLGVSAKTGEVSFQTNLFKQLGASAPRIHSKNSHASPTPLISSGRVYVHFGHMGTACLDLDGKVIWKNNELNYRPVHGNGGSPVLVDDHLIFSCDGAKDPFVIALHRDTGKVVWKFDRQSDAKKKFSFTTPAVIEVEGQKQIVSPGSNVVCGLDPKTGEEIWRVRYEGYSVIPKPVFGDGMIFICTGYDRPTLMAIRMGGKGDVTDTHVEWVEDKAVPHTPCLLLIDSALYMVSDRGIASCLKAKTGEVVWRERVGGAYSSSPIASNGRIYLQSEAGETHVLKVGEEYKVLSTHSLGERTLASYAAGDGAIFLRTADHLYRIEDK
jgi:outer membrane protein assembly factor BamB